MQRMTITVDDTLATQFDAFMKSRGYRNRSEAFRDLLREQLVSAVRSEPTKGECFATLTYVYDHRQRKLSERMTQMSHDHHDLMVSTLHVHLDHDNCMETAVLRGPMSRVRALAEGVIAQPGVRHGQLYVLPVEASKQTHKHGDEDQPHRHVHLTPIV